MHFNDNGNEIDYRETSDNDSAILNFNGQTIVVADDYHKLSFADFLKNTRGVFRTQSSIENGTLCESSHGMKL